MSKPARINPNVTKIAKRKWKLNEPFYGIPAGFVTDGASVPRPLWWFIDPAGEAFEAAIVHDFKLTIDTSKFKIESHRAFKNILIAYDVKVWKAYLAYWAVCIYWFGKGLIK